MFGVTQGRVMAPKAPPLPLLLLHHIKQARHRPRYHRYLQPYIPVNYHKNKKDYTTSIISSNQNTVTSINSSVIASTGIRFSLNPTLFVTKLQSQNNCIVVNEGYYNFADLYTRSSSKTAENSLFCQSTYSGWSQSKGSS
ncbi:hypothetical protein Ahia01_000196300 [Argonauta hians]